MLVIIVLSSISIAIEDPVDDHSEINQVWYRLRTSKQDGLRLSLKCRGRDASCAFGLFSTMTGSLSSAEALFRAARGAGAWGRECEAQGGRWDGGRGGSFSHPSPPSHRPPRASHSLPQTPPRAPPETKPLQRREWLGPFQGSNHPEINQVVGVPIYTEHFIAVWFRLRAAAFITFFLIRGRCLFRIQFISYKR